MGLTKTGLIEKIADRTDLSKKEATDAIDALLWTIETELKSGSDVNITGFGKFSVSDRPARMGRNPQTGEAIQIKASRVPKFTAGAALKKTVNNK